MEQLDLKPGYRVDMLEVIGKMPTRGKGQRCLWRCDCGGRYIGEVAQIKRRHKQGNRVSCGCLTLANKARYRAVGQHHNNINYFKLLWEAYHNLYDDAVDSQFRVTMKEDAELFELCPGIEPWYPFDLLVTNDDRHWFDMMQMRATRQHGEESS